MKLSSHPLWLVGFRPFFALACIAGGVLPVLWVLMFSGVLPPPSTALSMTQWHAHEMLFGFGWAVMGGFLLTATKNWVKVRGYHGEILMLLVIAWLIERVAMWFPDSLPPLAFLAANSLFLWSVIALVLWTLLRHRDNDGYRADNRFFLIILPTFLAAKYLLLSESHFAAGVSVTLGLFRMAFLVMLERTLTQFMKNTFQVDILRHPLLDGAIKVLALLFVIESFLPSWFAATLAFVIALLLLLRFLFWKPQLAFQRLDIGIMYLGYLALAGQLLIEAIGLIAPIAWVGSVSVHVFALGVIGLIVPAMLIRICKGHTGRKVLFDRGDKLVLWIMMIAFVLRIVAPQFFPAAYLRWIEISSAGWLAGFTLLAWRYTPYLLQARIDGKEH